MKTYIFIILLVHSSLFGQKLKSGIIIPATDSLKYSEKYCCILSPEQGFSVFDKPNGKKVGVIKRVNKIKSENQNLYNIYIRQQ